MILNRWWLCAVVVLWTVSTTAPQRQTFGDIQLLRYESNVGKDGYNFNYALSDGTERREEAYVDTSGPRAGILSVVGRYVWIGDDGVKHRVNYTADEKGYRATVNSYPREEDIIKITFEKKKKKKKKKQGAESSIRELPQNIITSLLS